MPRWLVAALCPLFFTSVFWMVLPPAYAQWEASDYDNDYRPEALELLAGNGFSLQDGSPAFRVPPGYSVLLAGTFGVASMTGLKEATAIKILTFISIAISSLLLFLISREVWGGWLALIPSFVWSTYPLALWMTKQPNSEVPFTAILFAACLALLRLTRMAAPTFRLAALVGVLSGASMLVRPIALLLPFVFAALVWRLGADWPRRVRVALGLTIVLSSAATIAPWEYHVTRVGGRFVLLGSGGPATMREGLTFAVNHKEFRRELFVPSVVRTVMLRFYAQYDQLDSFGNIVKAGLRELRQHPTGTIGLIGFKLWRAWYGTDRQRWDSYLLVIQLSYLSAVVWAARLVLRGGRGRHLLWMIGGVIGYFWIISLAGPPLVRYIVPALGLSFLLMPAIVNDQLQRRGSTSSTGSVLGSGQL